MRPCNSCILTRSEDEEGKIFSSQRATSNPALSDWIWFLSHFLVLPHHATPHKPPQSEYFPYTSHYTSKQENKIKTVCKICFLATTLNASVTRALIRVRLQLVGGNTISSIKTTVFIWFFASRTKPVQLLLPVTLISDTVSFPLLSPN